MHEIIRSDVGLVRRNTSPGSMIRALILFFFDTGAKFIDYGENLGLLVRMMQDLGYDFYRYDNQCENIFAKDFDVMLQHPGHFKLLAAY